MVGKDEKERGVRKMEQEEKEGRQKCGLVGNVVHEGALAWQAWKDLDLISSLMKRPLCLKSRSYVYISVTNFR